jgi:hypothetical protein
MSPGPAPDPGSGSAGGNEERGCVRGSSGVPTSPWPSVRWWGDRAHCVRNWDTGKEAICRLLSPMTALGAV